MRALQIALIISIALFIVACSKQDMPYKSLSDTRPAKVTGAVAIQKTAVKEQPKTEAIKEESTKEESASTNNNEAEQKGPTCKDSDYGQFPTAAGTVRGLLPDGTEYEMSDACFGDVLYEYYCEENNALISKQKCNRGCKNGFCV